MTRFASIILLALFALVACDSDSDNNANNDGSLAGNAGQASASGGASAAGRGGAITALGGATTTAGGRSGSGGSSATTNCGGLAGLACGTGQFCNYGLDAQCGAADQMGTCTAMPDACTMEYAPVCGCDGETYGNSCTARSAGVSVASEGACSN